MPHLVALKALGKSETLRQSDGLQTAAWVSIYRQVDGGPLRMPAHMSLPVCACATCRSPARNLKWSHSQTSRNWVRLPHFGIVKAAAPTCHCV